MILHKRQIAHVRRLTVEASQVIEASAPRTRAGHRAGPDSPVGPGAAGARRMPRPGKRKGAARPPGKAEGGPAAPRHARVAGAAPYPPTACAAVLSAMAGLTAEFGMGSGDPCLHGRARDGRATGPGSRPRGPTLGAAWRSGREEGAHAGGPRAAGAPAPSRGRARPISTARLSASRRLQLRPINPVVYRGPYRRVNSSRRRLPA